MKTAKQLTDRQTGVLQLKSNGLSDKQVAHELGLSADRVAQINQSIRSVAEEATGVRYENLMGAAFALQRAGIFQHQTQSHDAEHNQRTSRINTLEDFCVAISQVNKSKSLIDLFVSILTDRFDINLINYGAYGALDEFDRYTPHPTGTFSYAPVEWTDRYVERDYFTVDDAFKHLKQGGPVRTWESFERSVVFDEVSEFRCPEGLAVPLVGRGGVKAGLMIGGEKALALQENLAILGAYATLFHARYEMIGRRQSTASLLPFQIEVLKWMGQDKSKIEIAEILDQTPSNIDYHFREIYRKLGVGSKLAAVLTGLKMGLIDPEFDVIETTRSRGR